MPIPSGLFDTFCAEYQEFFDADKRPVSMTDDLQYALELQKNRLRSKGLTLRCTITPRGHFPHGGLSRDWSDALFVNRMDIRSCNWSRRISDGDKEVFRDSMDQTLYTTATDLIDGSGDIADEPCTCPGCGNVTTFEELRNGCPYCGSHFEPRELYPRVSGFYYVKEIGGTEQEVKKDVLRYVIPCAAAVGVFGLITSLLGSRDSIAGAVIRTVFSVLLSAGAGAVIGYLLWSFRKLGTVFYEALCALPLMSGIYSSRKKYESELAATSPDFSFDYFSNKVGTLARMLIFSDDPSSLPVCAECGHSNPYSDVVDALFRGPVIIRSFRRDGNICRVEAAAQFDLLYRKGSRFPKRRQYVTLLLSRDLSRPLNTHYSVRKVSCSSCGASFDASREDHCPYCGSQYDIRKEDWYVTAIV